MVVNIEGVKFEVIQIVDDTDPYPVLLGLDWAIDMDDIINLKRIRMEFENNGTRVIIPLDPAKGERYTEPVHVDDDIDHIYKMNVHDEDWINPRADGKLNWENYIGSCFSYFDEELDNW